MNRALVRHALLIGLGIVAGAVLPAFVAAQAPVPRDTLGRTRDTVPTPVDTAGARRVRPPAGRDTLRVPLPARADSMIRNDSIAQGIVPLPDRAKPDSVKPPLARAEAPPVIEIGASRIYDRAAIFATGSLQLSDLLGRVPGLTTFTTGWLAAPAVVASQGNLRRVRVFLDGLELDPMDQRAQGVAQVNDLPLHALEELRIERGADEVRVYARSWRVERTTPYTRADVGTGDDQTNLYRAFFGRRYDHGEALQVSAEQYSTQPNNRAASADGRSFLLRFGITKGPWSADLLGVRSQLTRDKWTGKSDIVSDTIPAYETRRTVAYARLGNGDPDGGRWIQAMASANAYVGTRPTSTSAFNAAQTFTVNGDTGSYVSQYLVTGGLRRGVLRVSAAQRLRVGNHLSSSTPSARASLESGALAISVLTEGSSILAPSRTEGTARFSLLDRVAVTASVSRTGGGTFERVFTGDRVNPIVAADGTVIKREGPVYGGYDSTRASRFQLAGESSSRLEAGVRLRDLWFTAGALRRGATLLLPPAELDQRYARATAARAEGSATATTAAIRGRLYKAVNIDAWAVAWGDSTGLYRPKFQTRSELYLRTNLLDRFPNGNFGLLASLAHEYRSSSRFQSFNDSIRVAPGFRTLDFRLEIRIQTAVVSYQFRNVLQERYQQVPGFAMARQEQFYGVRWDFWN